MPPKKVVKPIDPSDIIENRGVEKVEMIRGVEINGTNQNLTVTRSLNHKKGTFHIELKLNMNAITNDDILDTATLTTINQMIFAQRNECVKWRDEWVRKKKKDEDPDQMKMGLE